MDEQEMDVVSETKEAAVRWECRSILSEKAADLFDSLKKATASRSANWLSPASKSSDKESPEQSSRGKASSKGKRRSSTAGPDPVQRRLSFPASSTLPAGVVDLSDSD